MLDVIRNISLLFVFTFLMFSADIFAQVGATAGSCSINRINLEDTIRRPYFDSISNPKGSQFTQETVVIIIASLGSNETDRKYNVQRAKEVKDYLTSNFAFPDKLVVLAQGEKRKDEGRVEVYYGGVPQVLITFKPKEKLYLTGGEPCME